MSVLKIPIHVDVMTRNVVTLREVSRASTRVQRASTRLPTDPASVGSESPHTVRHINNNSTVL